MSEKEKNTQPPAATLSEADKIWNEIKDKEIDMFSLPGQKVSDFCHQVPIDPSRCFLIFKASSVLPSLETAIGNKYECSSAEKYIIVSRKQNAV